MKSSSLTDPTIDMALHPVPKWPKEDKSKEIDPFNPVFMYVFTDIMGVNKEVHKAQPHSISLRKIVDAGDGDLLKAFEILLPRIPECSDLPGSEIPQQLLLGASLAAYVSYLMWMAPRKTSKYLDGEGASQALLHFEKRKLMYTKALTQKPRWLQIAMRAMVEELGKGDPVEVAKGEAATPDQAEFDAPDG